MGRPLGHAHRPLIPPMTTELSIRPFKGADKANVIQLWNDCDLTRPWNNPAKDIDFCLAKPESTLFVGETDGRLIGSIMTGHDGHRGAIYYLAVHPDQQGRNFGRTLVRHAEDWLKKRGVWKVNLMIRDDNESVRDFYTAIGYEEEPRIVMARRLLEEE